MMEIDIMKLIQAEASSRGHRLFRNNCGIGWTGVYAGRTPDGTVTLRCARPLHAGLCVGSSDLIGFTSDGRFLAIEVKTDTGRPTPEQLQFIRIVRQYGGRAGIARNTDQAKDIINGTYHD